MVASQVAFSALLLVISAVLVEGFHNGLTQGPGFRTRDIYMLTFILS
jgi:hypothetical protein